METPFTYHIKREEYEFVYEPAEDTFLLLDALEEDLAFIDRLSPRICLEIGSGSGVIITALSKRLQNSFCFATDINAYACRITKRTSVHNNGRVDAINTNFTQGLRDKCVDLLVFNPPYVVTESHELDTMTLNVNSADTTLTNTQLVRTWAGGLNGSEVINALLPSLDTILSAEGVLYILILKENQPQSIKQSLKSFGFDVDIFKERKIPGEHLYILKVVRTKINENI